MLVYCQARAPGLRSISVQSQENKPKMAYSRDVKGNPNLSTKRLAGPRQIEGVLYSKAQPVSVYLVECRKKVINDWSLTLKRAIT